MSNIEPIQSANPESNPTQANVTQITQKRTTQTVLIKTQLEVEFVFPQIPNAMRIVGVNRAGSAVPPGQQKVENDSFLLDVGLLDDDTINQYLDLYKAKFLENVIARRAELEKTNPLI